MKMLARIVTSAALLPVLSGGVRCRPALSILVQPCPHSPSAVDKNGTPLVVLSGCDDAIGIKTEALRGIYWSRFIRARTGISSRFTSK